MNIINIKESPVGALKKILICLGICFVARGNASILIEPHIGYMAKGGIASYQNATATSASKYDYTGPQYGARLGLKYWGLMGGFDYTYSTYTRNRTRFSDQTKTSAENKQEEMGLFIGYNAPILIRAWVGYYFSSKITQTTVGTSGELGTWFKGNAKEIGIGFTPLPIISLNLVYRMLSFDTDHDASTGLTTALTPKFEPREIVLGISMPISFL